MRNVSCLLANSTNNNSGNGHEVYLDARQVKNKKRGRVRCKKNLASVSMKRFYCFVHCSSKKSSQDSRRTSFDLLFQAIRDVCNVFIPFEEVFWCISIDIYYIRHLSRNIAFLFFCIQFCSLRVANKSLDSMIKRELLNMSIIRLASHWMRQI